ncbi:hypothetical protein GGX14DRAFT_391531 [Mycena pura]|uniref:Uncharacterized protein n=1 Tax=Mycena pura TaxID=153505 RepID=A0AAD6YJL0_9AGAR|nr:hypothetical protein GGX14DRAFT_391531 [Mycena pura]
MPLQTRSTARNTAQKHKIDSDNETPHSDPKRVHLSNSRESSTTADSNVQNSSPQDTPSVLGQPTTVDTLLLLPLNSFEITADSAALHQLLMPAAYERITNYEMAIGVDFQLKNLAIANPSDYELRNNTVFRKDGDKAARFFIIGCVTNQSALCSRLVNKQHSVNIIPSIVGWGRATGVIHELLGDVSAFIFRGGGIPTSASPKKRALTRKAPATIPVSPKKDGTIQWDNFAARPADKPVPIYDARSVDFDIKNFQHLPKYDRELDAGMVVMVIFTMGSYSGADGEKLSLNVQAAVAMHDAVAEEDRPIETIIEAKTPLPVV